MIRVLVADDHPVVLAGLAGLLDAADDVTVVGTARDGEELVALALDHRPELVVTDLRMPVLDGIGATARIREALPDTRVLVLTTYDTDDGILAAIEAGASGYLLKAAPEAELLAAIRSVAGGEVVLAPRVAALLVGRVAKAQAPSMPALSRREVEVLRLVAAGRSNREVAAELFLGEATVKTHLQHVFTKLDVDDRTHAVTRAMELGLI